jgi:hypothetical protein
MRQEDLHRLRMLMTADLAECLDPTDEDEIEQILEDMYDGYLPAELSSDEYTVSMCGANGVAFGQYRSMRSIRSMTASGLIAPGPRQRKAVAGSFDLRFYNLIETGRRLPAVLEASLEHRERRS